MKTPDYSGTWEAFDEDSRAVFEIGRDAGNYAVSAYDKIDGEKFRVTNIRVEQGSLQFETYVRSTRHRAKHKLTLLRNGRMVQELTLIEYWKRVRKSRISDPAAPV